MARQQKENVIIDGDWGGDEMQLATVLLANPGKVKILGATCVFGNTAHEYVYKNARNILHFLKAANIPVYPGEEKPSDGPAPEGDGAHGKDGIGNASLDESPAPRLTTPSVDFILQQLRDNEPGTITITASGPLTNIAKAIRTDPDTMKKVKQIIVMGGCTQEMDAANNTRRQGNITPKAEFNFYMAPADAETVMQSGLPITLLPMNCTHQLTLTPKRQKEISSAYQTRPRIKQALLGNTNAAGEIESAYFEDKDAIKGMLSAPTILDRDKFNSAPVMHDINCALYLLHSDMYQTKRGSVSVSQEDHVQWPDTSKGHTTFNANPESNITVATDILRPNHLFQVFMTSLVSRIPPQQQATRVHA